MSESGYFLAQRGLADPGLPGEKHRSAAALGGLLHTGDQALFLVSSSEEPKSVLEVVARRSGNVIPALSATGSQPTSHTVTG